MNKKTKGILAGVAGIALLTGGATFAQWSDVVRADGASITSGKLDIATVGTPAWYDVSPDRAGNTATTPVTGVSGHLITPATWKIVPGDRAEATYSFDVTLQGDNLAAKLDVAGFEGVAGNGASASYKVYDSANQDITSKVKAGLLTFVASDAGSSLVTGDNVQVNATAHPDVHVVVTVDFPLTTTAHMEETVYALNEVSVALTQARGATAVAGF